MPFIPDNTALQQLINQSSQSAQTGPASVLDTMLMRRTLEQKNAQELFGHLVKANPKLAGDVAANNPDLLSGLIKAPSIVPPKGPGLGEQISLGFKGAKQDQPEIDAAHLGTLRLVIKDAQDMIQNGAAAGVQVKDPQGVIKGMVKSIFSGRTPGPEDLGLNSADYAKLVSSSPAKNIDALTHLTQLFIKEKGHEPNEEEFRGLVGLVLPNTAESAVSMKAALDQAHLSNANLDAQLASNALDRKLNGEPLTLEQRQKREQFITETQPVVDALQTVDNLWEKAMTGDAQAQKRLTATIIPLFANPMTRDAAIEIGQNVFDAGTRQKLKGVRNILSKTLDAWKRTRETGKQPRGADVQESGPSDEDVNSALDSLNSAMSGESSNESE